MPQSIESISEALFEKIRARFENVSVGDEAARATADPTKARFFNFDYVSKGGEKFGNVTVRITDDNAIKVFYGKNMTEELDSVQRQEWYDFLRDLRLFAKRYMLAFDTRDISRGTLQLRDLKNVSHDVAKDASTFTESKMYGTSKSSYELLGDGYRLVVKHSKPINTEQRGARSRTINSVFIETKEGERFKLPTTNLRASRALARHVIEGGTLADDFGKHVVDLVEEMGKIKGFLTASRNKTFEDQEANEMVEAAKERYTTIKETLNRLKGPRGYSFYKENWKPVKTLQDDIELECLRSKFVRRSFDDRMEEALPHVYRAYNEKRASAVDQQLTEFESEMDEIAEGRWREPRNEMDMEKLAKLLSSELIVGVDAENATAALYDLFGDDSLFDMLYNASVDDPEQDVSKAVRYWLHANAPEVSKKVETLIVGTKSNSIKTA